MTDTLSKWEAEAYIIPGHSSFAANYKIITLIDLVRRKDEALECAFRSLKNNSPIDWDNLNSALALTAKLEER